MSKPGRDEVALCAVCTASHLHRAITMARSALSAWSGPPPRFYLAVVDVARPPDHVARELPGSIVFAANELCITDWEWQRVRLSPHELCALFRPRIMLRALADGHPYAVYSDNDLYFFSGIEPLIEPLVSNSIAVTPHLLSPFPNDTALFLPALTDIFHAGVLNSGLFAVRNDGVARGFLETLERLGLGPGSFRQERGTGADQQLFNWVIAFADGVHVARDPRLNVAYWNLHERALSHQRENGHHAWTLGGRPIVCFHFSGLPSEADRLSLHDERHSLALNPNIAELVEFYGRQLADTEVGEHRGSQYGYQWVGGLLIDDEVRRAVNLHTLPPLSSGVAASDEAGLANISRLYQSIGSSIPVAPHLESIWRQRADLATLQAGPSLHPRRLLEWFDRGFRLDYPSLGAVHDALAPFAYPRSCVRARLAQAVGGDADNEDAVESFCNRRYQLRRGDPRQDALLFAHDPDNETRFLAQVAAQCLRLIYESRPDLIAAFPDPAGRDFERFQGWILGSFRREYAAPARIVSRIESLHPQESLARVLCFLRRRDPLRAQLRAGVSLRSLLPELLPLAEKAQEFDVDDLVLVDWHCERNAADVEQMVSAVLESGGAPAPGAPELQTAVNLLGYHRSPNGLGHLTAGLRESLDLAGFAVTPVSIGCAVMERGFRPVHLLPAIDQSATRNIFVSFPHIDYDLLDTFPRFVTSGRQNIAYLAWEQESFHPGWTRRFAAFDRLAAISTFSARAVAAATGREVWVWPASPSAPGAGDRDECRARAGFDDDDFIVGFVGDARSGIERKNPLASARAAIAAFAGDPRALLVLKLTQVDDAVHRRYLRTLLDLLESSGLRFVLLTERTEHQRVQELMRCFDVYVSLHRSEGFGLTLAEAMLLGTPVVATGYSGNMDYMSEANSLPVAWEYKLLEEAEGPFAPGTRWAEPSIEDAAAKLLSIRFGELDLAAMTARAKADVTAWCGPEAVSHRLRRDLLMETA